VSSVRFDERSEEEMTNENEQPKVGDKLIIHVNGKPTGKYQEVLEVDTRTGRLTLGPITEVGR
jgi:hypothetical protein